MIAAVTLHPVKGGLPGLTALGRADSLRLAGGSAAWVSMVLPLSLPCVVLSSLLIAFSASRVVGLKFILYPALKGSLPKGQHVSRLLENASLAQPCARRHYSR